MKNFDWDRFLTGKVVVHCNTEAKANDFLKQAHEHRLSWVREESLLEESYYDSYKEDTCYRAQFSTRMAFSDMSFYMEDNYKITEWEINEMGKFTETDLKVGMLIKNKHYDNFGYGIVMPSTRKDLSVVYKGEKWGDINFDNITEVWGYCEYAYEALNFSTKDRERLYKREEPKKMTVKEICELVGFDVEIVKE